MLIWGGVGCSWLALALVESGKNSVPVLHVDEFCDGGSRDWVAVRASACLALLHGFATGKTMHVHDGDVGGFIGVNPEEGQRITKLIFSDFVRGLLHSVE